MTFIELRADLLAEIHPVYQVSRTVAEALEAAGLPGIPATVEKSQLPDSVRELLRDEGERIRNVVTQISFNPVYSRLTDADPHLERHWHYLRQFWLWCLDHDLVPSIVSEDGSEEPCQSQIPPEPPIDRISDSLPTYLRESREWIVAETQRLWQGRLEYEFSQPLPDRYVIGDEVQADAIWQLLGKLRQLRVLWTGILNQNHNRFWNGVGMGSSRARLIHETVKLHGMLTDPPTEERLEACSRFTIVTHDPPPE
jgi:hypothetical protein